MHQSVQQWWNMPEGNPWSYAPVLHTFQVVTRGWSNSQKCCGTCRIEFPCFSVAAQRIVELQESWRIMVEFNTHGGAGQQYQDHKVRWVVAVARTAAWFPASGTWAPPPCRRYARLGSCVRQTSGSPSSGGRSCSAGVTRCVHVAKRAAANKLMPREGICCLLHTDSFAPLQCRCTT